MPGESEEGSSTPTKAQRQQEFIERMSKPTRVRSKVEDPSCFVSAGHSSADVRRMKREAAIKSSRRKKNRRRTQPVLPEQPLGPVKTPDQRKPNRIRGGGGKEYRRASETTGRVIIAGGRRARGANRRVSLVASPSQFDLSALDDAMAGGGEGSPVATAQTPRRKTTPDQVSRARHTPLRPFGSPKQALQDMLKKKYAQKQAAAACDEVASLGSPFSAAAAAAGDMSSLDMSAVPVADDSIGGGVGQLDATGESLVEQTFFETFAEDESSFMFDGEMQRLLVEGVSDVIMGEDEPRPNSSGSEGSDDERKVVVAPKPVQQTVWVNDKAVPFLDYMSHSAVDHKIRQVFQLPRQFEGDLTQQLRTAPFALAFASDEQEGPEQPVLTWSKDNTAEQVTAAVAAKFGIESRHADGLLRAMVCDSLLAKPAYPVDAVLRLTPFIRCWNEFYRPEKYGSGLPEIQIRLNSPASTNFKKTITNRGDNSYVVDTWSCGELLLQLGDIGAVHLCNYETMTHVGIQLNADGSVASTVLKGFPEVTLCDNYTCEFDDGSPNCALSELFIRGITKPFFEMLVASARGVRGSSDIQAHTVNFEMLTKVILNTLLKNKVAEHFLNGGEEFLVEAGKWRFLAKHGKFDLLLQSYRRDLLSAENVGRLFFEYGHYAGLAQLHDTNWLEEEDLEHLLVKSEFDVLVALNQADFLATRNRFDKLSEHGQWGYVFQAWLNEFIGDAIFHDYLQDITESNLIEQIRAWSDYGNGEVARAMIFCYMYQFPGGVLTSNLGALVDTNAELLSWIRVQLGQEEEADVTRLNQSILETIKEGDERVLSGVIEETYSHSVRRLAMCVSSHDWAGLQDIVDWSWLDGDLANILLRERQYELLARAEHWALLAEHGKTDLLEENGQLVELVKAHFREHLREPELMVCLETADVETLESQHAAYNRLASTSQDFRGAAILQACLQQKKLLQPVPAAAASAHADELSSHPDEQADESWLSDAVVHDAGEETQTDIAWFVQCIASHEWGELDDVVSWSWLTDEQSETLLHERQYGLLAKAEKWALLADNGKTDLLEQNGKLIELVRAHLRGRLSKRKFEACLANANLKTLRSEILTYIRQIEDRADVKGLHMLCQHYMRRARTTLEGDDVPVWEFIEKAIHYAAHTSEDKAKIALRAVGELTKKTTGGVQPLRSLVQRVSMCMHELRQPGATVKLKRTRHMDFLAMLVVLVAFICPPALAVIIPLIRRQNTKGAKLVEQGCRLLERGAMATLRIRAAAQDARNPWVSPKVVSPVPAA